MWRLLLQLMTGAALAASGLTKPVDSQTTQSESVLDGLYVAAGRSREDWAACGGITCDQWKASQRALTLLTVLEANGDVTQVLNESPEDHDTEDEGADILLTPEQAEFILRQEKARTAGHVPGAPQKRKITSLPVRIWQLPLSYKFDGDFSGYEQSIMRKAMRQWEDNTCVRFNEVALNADMTENHLLFTQQLRTGCASYIGKVDQNASEPQIVNLPFSCLLQLGTPVHEIGHALGLWHEHQRPSRDEFVNVHTEALHSWASVNFIKGSHGAVDEHGVPYDFNSVMHYSGKTASRTGAPTITSKDPRFQSNMGQRVQLSFLDAKVINTVYCKDSCPRATSLYCKRGGYPNPNNCNTCLCPPGLGGRLCSQAERSVQADCSATIKLTDGQSVNLTSPGYQDDAHYRDYTSCNWLIKAERGSHISVKFDEDFGVYSRSGACYHWVEVQYNNDYTTPGPRLCGRDVDFSVESERSEMLITFRSSHRAPTSSKRRFSVTVTSVPSNNSKQSPPRVTSRPPTPRPVPTVILPVNREETTDATEDVTYSWSSWSRCDSACQCGGCSTRSRYRLCDGKRCGGAAEVTEEEPCSRVCTTGDRQPASVGSSQQSLCPRCCSGYKRLGGHCVTKRQ